MVEMRIYGISYGGVLMKKIILILTGLIIILILGNYIKNFHIGMLYSVNEDSYSQVDVGDSYIKFSLENVDSALKYARSEIRVEDDKVYVKNYHVFVRKVMVNNNMIYLDFDTSDINEVYLEDHENDVLIWYRE